MSYDGIKTLDVWSTKVAPQFVVRSSSETQGQIVLCFSAQSKGRTAATVWNWSGKTLSPGALLAVLYFSSCHIFPPG